MRDLSVLIPARNEVFLAKTMENVLANTKADTEIIAVLDGYWPAPPIRDDSRVTFVHYTVPIGQRAAVNAAARLSEAKYIMKLDAHCAVDKGFDVKLIEPYERKEIDMDTTTIPRMYNLHAFDWVCVQCGARYYQADPVDTCKCGSVSFTEDVVWRHRTDRLTDFAMFDNNLQFKYWRRYNRRPEAQADISDVMSSVGACFFMPRKRFLELDGMDEGHGFWGQFGTEVACKSWLSGGRQVVNKRTWFSHFFRVGKLKFPYPITGNQQERAREYSREFWFNNKWDKAKLPLKWLIDKFAPVPTWEEMQWHSMELSTSQA